MSVPYDDDAQEIVDRVYSAHRGYGSIISQDPIIAQMWAYCDPGPEYEEMPTKFAMQLEIAMMVVHAIDHLDGVPHPDNSAERIKQEFAE